MQTDTPTFTVTLQKSVPKPFFKIGDLVKIKSKKRVWGKVVTINDQNNFTIRAVYRPSPRSKVNKKSPFTKIIIEVIPLNKTKTK